MKKLILASSSPRRKELLEKAGISFSVEVSNFEEYMDMKLSACELTKALSLGKAKKIASVHAEEDVIILAADTIVVFEDTYLGKPKSREEAFKTLKMLSGSMHKIVTGFTIIDLPSGKIVSDCDVAKLYFKPFSEELIKEYLDKNTFMDKAGSYAIQDLDERYINHIDGDKETIIGLPTKPIRKILNKLS